MVRVGKLSVAFDVDGTLIYERDGSPRYEVIQFFQLFKLFGCEMYIWSSEGEGYAKQQAIKLGLEDATVVEKGSFRPDITVDDYANMPLGLVNLCVGNPIIKGES